jgi:hypothetical protein
LCFEGIKRTKSERAADTFNPSNKPFLEFFLDFGRLSKGRLFVALGHDLGALGARKEVNQVNNAVFVDVACL